MIHGFDNDGDAEVQYLNLHSPDSGFIDYMRAVRDKTGSTDWDSFDPPADGGLPRSEAVIVPPGERAQAGTARPRRGRALPQRARAALKRGSQPATAADTAARSFFSP